VLPVPSFVEGMTQITGYSDADVVLKLPTTLSGRLESSQFMGSVIPQLNGPEHIKRRQVESRIFATASLTEWERSGLREAIDALLIRLATAADEHGVVRLDLPSTILRVLTNLAAAIVGLDGVDTADACEDLLGFVNEYVVGSSVEWLKTSDDERDRVRQHALNTRAEFRTRYLDAALSRRTALIAGARAAGRDDDVPRDIITSLLVHDRPDWDADFMTQQVLMYLSASIGTSTRAITNAVHELLNWFVDHPADRQRAIDDADFLHRAVDESLRLHVVVPALLRRTTAPVTLPSGIHLEAGERFTVLIGQANRDPEVFGADADAFDPDRALRPGINRPAGFAFAAGPHTCIGKRLAVGGGAVIKGVTPNEGTVVTLVRTLLRVNIMVDPDALPPRQDPGTDYDEFVEYAVRIDGLPVAVG
jgi:cytochrome P450